MANYYAKFRSNYFKVKDVEKFKQWAELLLCTVYPNSEETAWAIFSSEEQDCGGLPTDEYIGDRSVEELTAAGWTESDIQDERREVDFFSALSKHLVEGEVAVVMEVGSEKQRYLSGYSFAVNHAGKVLRVSIDDIYHLAFKEFGVEPTEAAY